MDWLTAAWHLWGWGLSASSSAVSLMATLPGGCRQSVGHALVTCGWGAPPYFAPGLAPLPVCWGWLAAGVLVGLLLREALAILLMFAGGAQARAAPLPAATHAATEVLRSWSLGGEQEVAELAAQSGQSATELLCALLQQTLPSTHTRAAPGRPALTTRRRGPRNATRAHDGTAAGAGHAQKVNMLRRAIQPVHAQMLLSHACLLHLSQPFAAVAASTTRSQPCSAACAITVSRRKATFVTHAGTLTPSSPSYIRGASAYGRPSRPQACCTEWQLHSRPCHGAPRTTSGLAAMTASGPGRGPGRAETPGLRRLGAMVLRRQSRPMSLCKRRQRWSWRPRAQAATVAVATVLAPVRAMDMARARARTRTKAADAEAELSHIVTGPWRHGSRSGMYRQGRCRRGFYIGSLQTGKASAKRALCERGFSVQVHPSPYQFRFLRRGIPIPLRGRRIGEASHPGPTRTNNASPVIGSNGHHATDQRARTLQALSGCGLVREPLPHTAQAHGGGETTASGSAGPRADMAQRRHRALHALAQMQLCDAGSALGHLRVQVPLSGESAPDGAGDVTPEFASPAGTPVTSPRRLRGPDWQAQGPPTTRECDGTTTLSRFFVPLLLSAAGLLEDAAARAWQGLPWFRASREALTNRPLTPLAQLQQAIAQQMTAGAAPTPQEGFATPGGCRTLQRPSLLVAVAALAAEDHYLAASSQEALLLCFAGDAGAAQISRGAAAMQSSRPTPRREAADSLTPDLDAHVARVAGATAGAPRARGRGRRGRGGRGRGRQQHRPPSGDPAAPTQIDAGTDSETLGPAALTAPARPSRAHATPLHRHLPCLRETDLRAEFEHRVYTFQSPPRQLRGLLRNALRVSLEAIRDDAGTDTERDGWKLLLLAPCMLLFRTPGVAHVPPQEFKRRERLFCEGSWTQLLRESVAAAQPAQPVRDAVRAPESPQVGSESDIRRRADRASALAHLGEMSAAAKALTAPPLAPATAETLQALRDPVRRPPEAQVPIHPSVDPICRPRRPRSARLTCSSQLAEGTTRSSCGPVRVHE